MQKTSILFCGRHTGNRLFAVIGQLGDQTVYMNSQVSETLQDKTPNVYELQKAIHCSLLSPTGVHPPQNKPIKPDVVRIFNRWGEKAYKTTAELLKIAGIPCIFQSRKEAVKEAKEAGNDPGGLGDPLF